MVMPTAIASRPGAFQPCGYCFLASSSVTEPRHRPASCYRNIPMILVRQVCTDAIDYHHDECRLASAKPREKLLAALLEKDQ
jgi:hypothetical protein